MKIEEKVAIHCSICRRYSLGYTACFAHGGNLERACVIALSKFPLRAKQAV